MSEDKITALLEQEEKLLTSAVARTMQAYNQSPVVANLKDYEAAKKAIEDFRRRKATAENPEAQTFKNLLEVLDYLQAEGWKISKSTLYEKSYAIKKQPDGAYLKKNIDDFAAKFLRKLDGSDTEEIDIAEKIKAEIRKLTAEAEKREIEVQRLKGEVVDRYEVEQQFADRAAFLIDSLKNFSHSQMPRLIELVRGDTAYAAEAIDFFNAEVETLFDHYSKPLTFSVAAYNENGDREDAT